jgi:hypothetical protein
MSRRPAASGLTISLFPFLAVLLCMMGALLVLLVLFSRQAQRAESAQEQAARRELQESLTLAREEFGWRLEQLRGIRDRTAADLARARMALAGVEEDSRKLADELDGLQREAGALAAAPRRDADRDGAAAIRELQEAVTAATKSLDALREGKASRPPAYAVVPYEGANGTHRRPLYIECCIDGVFLQPEGVRLGPADFEGPPGPGNPLASALRAAREHVARGPRESGDPAAQPYPLLLVRPSGVMAYYAARESIQSWGSEFGYQFVDEDWQIDYPPPDPALAEVELRAVEESRRRMAWLAQNRPARPPRPTKQYRAATSRGGVVAEGGPSVLGDQSRFDWTEERAGVGGRGGMAGGDAPGAGDVILGGQGSGGGSGSGSGSGPMPATAGTAGDRYAGPSRFYAANPPGAVGAGDGSGHEPGGFPGGMPGGTAAAGNAVAGNGATAGRGAAGGTRAGGGPGGPAGSASTGAGTSAAFGGNAAGGAAGNAAGGGSSGSTSESASAATGGGGGDVSGPSLPGMPQGQAGGTAGSASGQGSASDSASLAGSRGSNWASLATQDRPIPLTRPIRIECSAREFRILDDASGRAEARVAIGTETVTAIDPLVQAIHAKVARWGIAGHRMYWNPELILGATADGEGRREDLERLLADSGLQTRRRAAADDVRRLPPVERTTALAPRP